MLFSILLHILNRQSYKVWLMILFLSVGDDLQFFNHPQLSLSLSLSHTQTHTHTHTHIVLVNKNQCHHFFHVCVHINTQIYLLINIYYPENLLFHLINYGHPSRSIAIDIIHSFPNGCIIFNNNCTYHVVFM